MPLIILLMVVIGSVYQLFFRYEHWIDTQQNQIVYERDNLTGQTHIIRPGEDVNFFSRLIGNFGESVSKSPNGPFALSLIEEEETNESRPPIRTEASGEPIPEPTGDQPTSISDRSDLNRDGVTERVLIHQTANDGLLDISILEGQREIFYGRGARIDILPTNTAGWSDISLVINNTEQLKFQYNPALSGYEVKSR